MSSIQLLSDDLINKIAAGEVVERPASVVKELIENSLDAGATKIVIEVEDSGKKLIKVADNGLGMGAEDARQCILRHATSKIKDEQDLCAIATLGFRGEALASIAAVSRVSITTKRPGEVEGYTIVVEGGKIIHSTIAGAQAGTSVEVRNLFFNTPARKKFLKTDAVELRHLIDTGTRYALIHPTVSFRLLHDNHELLNAPAVDDLRSNIAFIYGVNLAKEMLEIGHAEQGIAVSGFVAPPYHARNDKSQQSVFVNKRWVRNMDIINTVYDAYHSLLFINKHPVLVLNVTIDPAQVDVNIHPTKAEIKFARREQVYNAILNAVQQALQQHNLIPTLNPAVQQLTLEQKPQSEPVPPQETFYPFEPSTQTVFQVKERSSYPPGQTAEPLSPPAMEMAMEMALEQAAAEPLALPRFPPLRLLGQIHKTFFVAEALDGLFYIDQHAAHERVLYERFMQQYLQQEVQVQQLLRGEVIELSPAEAALVKEHKHALQELGFGLEPFGGNSIVLKTVPLLLGRLQSKEVFYEVLSLLKEGKHKLLQTKEEIVTRMACRAAIMAGDTIAISEMESHLQELAKTKLPFTCPHGRPTLIKVDVNELEKRFRRKG